MKKLLTSLLLLGCFGLANAQASHMLLSTDFYFDPDTLYISPGDTVNVIINGYHSVTEIDSVDWVANMDNHNGGFDVGLGAVSIDTWFVINDPGKYYYICGPHAAMEMKGLIYVQGGLGIEAAFDQKNFTLFHSNGQVQLEYLDSDQVNIFDIHGNHLFEAGLDAHSTKANISLGLSQGAYIARFSRDGHVRVSKKVLVLE